MEQLIVPIHFTHLRKIARFGALLVKEQRHSFNNSFLKLKISLHGLIRYARVNPNLHILSIDLTYQPIR